MHGGRKRTCRRKAHRGGKRTCRRKAHRGGGMRIPGDVNPQYIVNPWSSTSSTSTAAW
jgi:hypothetical protein